MITTYREHDARVLNVDEPVGERRWHRYMDVLIALCGVKSSDLPE